MPNNLSPNQQLTPHQTAHQDARRVATEPGIRNSRLFRGFLGVEFDGRSSHGSDGAFVADRRRRNRIETIGWGLLEITMIHVTREYTQTGALILATLNGRWRDAH